MHTVGTSEMNWISLPPTHTFRNKVMEFFGLKWFVKNISWFYGLFVNGLNVFFYQHLFIVCDGAGAFFIWALFISAMVWKLHLLVFCSFPSWCRGFVYVFLICLSVWCAVVLARCTMPFFVKNFSVCYKDYRFAIVQSFFWYGTLFWFIVTTSCLSSIVSVCHVEEHWYWCRVSMVRNSRLGFYRYVLKVSRPVLLLCVKSIVVCYVVFVSMHHV